MRRLATLQCGRIYKDAEILRRTGRVKSRNSRLQCGRIYKDAEMFGAADLLFLTAWTFNVAASIKMRKSGETSSASGYVSNLQCGRIYKDAEIQCARLSYRIYYGLQCGRIYKDAEIATAIPCRIWFISLQCGRIYKDAEIDCGCVQRIDRAHAFNVAASIKMRK